MTRKSGHIWRIWVEMTQTLMPKSTKVAQIHLPECNSAKIRQIFLNFTKFAPKFAPKFRQNSPNLPKFVSQKGSNFEHPNSRESCSECGKTRKVWPLSRVSKDCKLQFLETFFERRDPSLRREREKVETERDKERETETELESVGVDNQSDTERERECGGDIERDRERERETPHGQRWEIGETTSVQK